MPWVEYVNRSGKKAGVRYKRLYVPRLSSQIAQPEGRTGRWTVPRQNSKECMLCIRLFHAKCRISAATSQHFIPVTRRVTHQGASTLFSQLGRIPQKSAKKELLDGIFSTVPLTAFYTLMHTFIQLSLASLVSKPARSSHTR